VFEWGFVEEGSDIAMVGSEVVFRRWGVGFDGSGEGSGCWRRWLRWWWLVVDDWLTWWCVDDVDEA
jgi:hypothetical protein